jgi:hypothetical protein
VGGRDRPPDAEPRHIFASGCVDARALGGMHERKRRKVPRLRQTDHGVEFHWARRRTSYGPKPPHDRQLRIRIQRAERRLEVAVALRSVEGRQPRPNVARYRKRAGYARGVYAILLFVTEHADQVDSPSPS